MTKKQAYSYTVLRYVHDVVAGEALNVGVVLHSPAPGFLKARTRKTITRLRNVFPDLERHDFVEAMRSVDRGVIELAKKIKGEPLFNGHLNAREYSLKVLPQDDSALQWSPVGTGLTTDPAQTLERLYERFVVRYDRKGEKRRTDEDVWRPVREKLAEREISVPFEPKVVKGEQDQIEFKKAWKNGRWHAYEPISLDLADADHIKDKARRWRGHLSAVAEGASEDIQLHFILGAPQNASLIRAYESAKEILKGSRFKPEIFEESDAEELVSEIEDEYRSSLASR